MPKKILFHRQDGTLDHSVFDGDETVGAAACSGVHNPKSVLQLMAYRFVSVAEKKNIYTHSTGIGDSAVKVSFYAPQMAVGEKKLFSSQLNLFFQGDGGPAVTVAGDNTEGDFGIDIAELFRILQMITQMYDLIRVVEFDGIVHSAFRAVGIRKNQNFHTSHLTNLVAYTELNE